MPKRNRLTNNSDETDVSSMLSGDTIFSIPYFQRAYKWKPQRLSQLEEDILSIVDTSSDLHFLGAVIIHGRRANPSDPTIFDVIDGQQRITTLFLYIAAAVRFLIDSDHLDEASGLFLKYLAIGRDTPLPSNLKLYPCKEDRAQFNEVISSLLDDGALEGKLGSFKAKYLPSTGRTSGILSRNYRSAVRFIKSEFEQGGLARVRAVYEALLDNISVVQIDVWDPTNGPKIFDSLNSRQEPMTIGDLVRNEIFARVAAEEYEEIDRIDEQYWQPFYRKFQQNGRNLFDAYFFPFGLIHNPNLTKSEVYNFLRKEWKDLRDPPSIILNLSLYQDAFLDIAGGSNGMDHPDLLAEAFRNLYQLGAPSSTYPFLMQLSRAASQGEVSARNATQTLRIIESFLVRRAIVGHEPTGLHAVFKRLWADVKSDLKGSTVGSEIASYKTVVWPNDASFREAVQSRPLYKARITPYFLLQYNKSLGGDIPETVPWIEHVLPERPSEEWFDDFSDSEHLHLKDTLANLIPLSKEMNIELSNKPYTIKRPSFKLASQSMVYFLCTSSASASLGFSPQCTGASRKGAGSDTSKGSGSVSLRIDS
ncbi:MAG: DUF262 domain-containing protein [Anaerolineales bacterium]